MLTLLWYIAGAYACFVAGVVWQKARQNTKASTPSASQNSLPQVESCLDGIAGTNKWVAHHEWVLGAEAMHEYISRKLQQ